MDERRVRPDYQADFSRYFQDELKYLEELGAEHARRDPGRSHFDFAAISDPDVLCLLQGFSFLTARIRQNLDDELPEVSHSLLELLFPHYLRATPAMSVLQFAPQPGVVQGRLSVPAGTQIDSRPVEGTACRFRTCFEVGVTPITIERARLERGEGREGAVRIRFAAVGPADLAKVDLSRIRLYLTGGDEDARTLLWLFCTQVHELVVEWPEAPGDDKGTGPRRSRRVSARDCIRHVGLEYDGPDEAATSLLPYPPRSFGAYRLLQEYFSFPNKFNFVELVLDPEQTGRTFEDASKLKWFDVVLQIADVPGQLPPIDERRFALHCTPIVNLFRHDAEPLLVDHSRTEYVIRPREGGRRHYEVWSVERVTVVDPVLRSIPPFFMFHSSVSAPPGTSTYFEPRLRPARIGFLDDENSDNPADSTDMFLRFVTSDYALAPERAAVGPSPSSVLPQVEKLSVELLCTNRFLPLQLQPGDICVPGGTLPSGLTLKGIERISPAVPPPMGSLVHWRLLSHLALTRISLTNVDTLRGILEVYDFQARADAQALRRSRKRLAALRSVRAERLDTLLEGVFVPLVQTTVEVDADGFMGTGDLYVFGCVLSRFLGAYVAVNCTSRLRIVVPATGLTLEFPVLRGAESLL